MKADSLIFDLDGTLWDASKSCIMAWNSALNKLGVHDFVVTPTLASNFSGKLLDTIFAEHFSFLRKEKLNELAASYEREEKVYMKNHGGDLYPGIREAVETLSKQYKLFIVSNCMNGYIENFFHWHQLESFFTDYTCSGATGKSKAENIALVISRNRLNNPVYVGDTIGDQKAAMQNDIPFIYARYGFGSVENAEFVIDDLKELESILKYFAQS